MPNFLLSTDSTCDWKIPDLVRHNIFYKCSAYYCLGENFPDMCSTDTDFRKFYDFLRAGNLPTTSQLNEQVMEDYFTDIISNNDGDLVHITISSGIGGGTYPNSVKAAQTVMEKFQGRKIYVIDSLGGTRIQGVLVDKGLKFRTLGLTALETYNKLLDLSTRIHTIIMPRDLFHLQRGGRVSRTSALVGSILQIKPQLQFTKDGFLEVTGKVNGWTKGMHAMVKFALAEATDIKNDGVYIAHADCFEDACDLRDMIQQAVDCPVDIGWIGPVIGCHAGAGTIGLGVIGKERTLMKK